jgi:hypothetical protein
MTDGTWCICGRPLRRPPGPSGRSGRSGRDVRDDRACRPAGVDVPQCCAVFGGGAQFPARACRRRLPAGWLQSFTVADGVAGLVRTGVMRRTTSRLGTRPATADSVSGHHLGLWNEQQLDSGVTTIEHRFVSRPGLQVGQRRRSKLGRSNVRRLNEEAVEPASLADRWPVMISVCPAPVDRERATRYRGRPWCV